MNKIMEAITASVQVFPTVGSSVSSSALLGVDHYRNVVLKAFLHKLPDAKGEGVATLSAYQATASTWNGAVAAAISGKAVTVSLNSVTNRYLEVEVRAAEMSVNSAMNYIGAYLALPTSCVNAITIERGNSRFEPI